MPVRDLPTLKELLGEAHSAHYAVGAFNIFDYLSAKAAIDAANAVTTPILLQTSVGTVKQFGPQALFEMLALVRKNAGVPVLVHLDHCTDPALAKTCVDTGWDSVMVDISAKPLAENIAITKEVKKYALNRGTCVEGELGIIKGVEEDLSYDSDQLAGYEDSIRFIEETGIDAFAPAIGTAHGLYKSEVKLNFDLVKKLADTTDTPIVVHGGTGLSDGQFTRLIRCGASKINVSTALKYAYIDGLRNYWETHHEDYNPVKLNNAAEESVRHIVKEHILRFKPDLMKEKT
ncbi:MAG: class II fructose-bisphosphate aldolase [Treponema sp.]|jgi:fructose-bisphosphate aldolase class II|nr:class II fructose-bisphosphate aldolase [Treponema sp.]